MDIQLRIWWGFLCTAALVNTVLWLRAARALRRRWRSAPQVHGGDRRLQLWLAAVYVLGCGFRSVLPRADVQRICLVDSPLSSVFVGRAVATVAELAFALQWALFIRELADGTGVASARRIARVLVPLIVWAELCSWYAVVTSNFLGNALEQSTWLLCGMLIAFSFQQLWPRLPAEARAFGRKVVPAIAGFIVFMSLVDVPLYLSRWQADETAHRRYLTIAAGLRDASRRWIVEHTWPPWRPEAAWMALYFSVGVWVSIGLSSAPSVDPEHS